MSPEQSILSIIQKAIKAELTEYAKQHVDKLVADYKMRLDEELKLIIARTGITLSCAYNINMQREMFITIKIPEKTAKEL